MDGVIVDSNPLHRVLWSEFNAQHGITTTDAMFERMYGKRTDAVIRDQSGRLAASGPFMIGGWEIAPEGGGTRFTGWARHWTDEARKQHEEMGFTPGWSAVADQLKALCEAR